jgi:hypothetical protein
VSIHDIRKWGGVHALFEGLRSWRRARTSLSQCIVNALEHFAHDKASQYQMAQEYENANILVATIKFWMNKSKSIVESYLRLIAQLARNIEHSASLGSAGIVQVLTLVSNQAVDVNSTLICEVVIALSIVQFNRESFRSLGMKNILQRFPSNHIKESAVSLFEN